MEGTNPMGAGEAEERKCDAFGGQVRVCLCKDKRQCLNPCCYPHAKSIHPSTIPKSN